MHQKGFYFWFTELCESGKSTTAEVLLWLLLEHDHKGNVVDGDVKRPHLSKGLGFSKKDRYANVRRFDFVASELVPLGVVAICVVVSPYSETSNNVCSMVGKEQFVEVFVDTHFEIYESQDIKSLNAKFRNGEIYCVT